MQLSQSALEGTLIVINRIRRKATRGFFDHDTLVPMLYVLIKMMNRTGLRRQSRGKKVLPNAEKNFNKIIKILKKDNVILDDFKPPLDRLDKLVTDVLVHDFGVDYDDQDDVDDVVIMAVPIMAA